jgi:hypothetical protein
MSTPRISPSVAIGPLTQENGCSLSTLSLTTWGGRGDGSARPPRGQRAQCLFVSSIECEFVLQLGTAGFVCTEVPCPGTGVEGFNCFAILIEAGESVVGSLVSDDHPAAVGYGCLGDDCIAVEEFDAHDGGASQAENGDLTVVDWSDATGELEQGVLAEKLMPLVVARAGIGVISEHDAGPAGACVSVRE